MQVITLKEVETIAKRKGCRLEKIDAGYLITSDSGLTEECPTLENAKGCLLFQFGGSRQKTSDIDKFR